MMSHQIWPFLGSLCLGFFLLGIQDHVWGPRSARFGRSQKAENETPNKLHCIFFGRKPSPSVFALVLNKACFKHVFLLRVLVFLQKVFFFSKGVPKIFERAKFLEIRYLGQDVVDVFGKNLVSPDPLFRNFFDSPKNLGHKKFLCLRRALDKKT